MRNPPIWLLLLMTCLCQMYISPCHAQHGFPITVVPNVGEAAFGDDRVLLSADGRVLAIADAYASDAIELWDVTSGRPIRKLSHSAFTESFVFLEGGKQIASAHKDATIVIWDIAAGKKIATLRGPDRPRADDDPDAVRSLWVDKTGRHLVSGDDGGRVLVWNVRERKHSHSIRLPAKDKVGNYPRILAARLSSSGDKLIVVADDRAIVYDLKTKRPLHSYPPGGPPKDGKTDYQFRSDSIIGDDLILLEQSKPGCDIRSLMLVQLGPTAASRMLDEAPACNRPEEWKGAGQYGTPVVITAPSAGDVLMARRGIAGLKSLNLATLQIEQPETSPASEDSALLALFPEHRLGVSVARDRLRLYDMATGAAIRELRKYGAGADRVVRSNDGKHIMFSLENPDDQQSHKDLNLWDIRVPVPKVIQLQNSADVTIRDYAPGPNLVLGTTEKAELVVLSADTREVKSRYPVAGFKRFWSAAISPDGQLIAALGANEDENLAVLVRVSDGLVQHRFQGRDHPDRSVTAIGGDDLSDFVTSAAFYPDGTRVVVGRWNGTAEIWDARTFQRIRTLPRANKRDDVDQIITLAIAPDGKHLLGGTRDSGIFLWNAETGRFIRTFPRQSVWGYTVFSSLAMSGDGKLVVGGVSKRATSSGELNRELGVKVWETATGKQRFNLEGHEAAVRAVTFSPNDKWIISASSDGVMIYWDRETGKRVATFTGGQSGRWMAVSESGFFSGSQQGSDLLAIVRGLEVTSMDQLHQSLFNPDLVRELVSGDPNGEVKAAAKAADIGGVIASGPAPLVAITSHPTGTQTQAELVTVEGRITDRGKGVGRVEWRVNGITVGVRSRPDGRGPEYPVSQLVALDPGENVIEIVAYNASNLLASPPARTTISYNGPADTTKAKLHVLAVGINAYTDGGWSPPGAPSPARFAPLKLAVTDAQAFAAVMKSAGSEHYGDVRVTLALDTDATLAKLDDTVGRIAAEMHPRDTFVLFAAAHGYSTSGRFYLIPQDYQGGPNPVALAHGGIGQDRLQDWIANRIRAKKALILLDTCESGALVAGHLRSRTDAPAAEASVGRLHEATGRPVLTAAAAGKPAWEGYKGHGVFTWALIDGLRNGDANGNGTIELSELVTHVQNLVPKLSAEVGGRGHATIAVQETPGDGQSARFGSRGEDFAIARTLQ